MIDPKDLVPVDPNDAGAAKDFLKKNGVSLTPGEYARVCELLGRRPTIVELHMFNVMWSEHCSYKSSRWALKEYLPTDAPHVVLGPGEDAGIIRFCEAGGKSWCLVMAHESHNHPSQVLPVEGAATGIGGIVRDVYCMGADVIGVMDPLRFGDPDGPNAAHVRDIAFGVVEGIAQYGNALGVPNYGGDVLLRRLLRRQLPGQRGRVRYRGGGRHHPGAACRKKRATCPTTSSWWASPPTPVGFGGAAFASERLDGSSAVEKQGAVQVPDPFVKRVLAEAIREMLKFARENKIPIGFKDLGAGGDCVRVLGDAGGEPLRCPHRPGQGQQGLRRPVAGSDRLFGNPGALRHRGAHARHPRHPGHLQPEVRDAAPVYGRGCGAHRPCDRRLPLQHHPSGPRGVRGGHGRGDIGNLLPPRAEGEPPLHQAGYAQARSGGGCE